MTHREILKAIRERFRAKTVRKVGDWLVWIPDYERRLLGVTMLMEDMRTREWMDRDQWLEITPEERADVALTFEAAVGAIDDAQEARRPVKQRDGILWVDEPRIQRKGSGMFDELWAFTDKPAGVFLMDIIWPGYREDWEAAQPPKEDKVQARWRRRNMEV